MGKLSIFFKFLYTEIYSSVCHCISISFIHKSLDHADHAVNFLSCLRMCSSRLHVHSCHILFALFNISLGNFFCGNSLFDCFFDDLVIYVCKVGYIVYFVSFIFQITADCIKNDHWTCITNMDQVVYSRSADIHFYLSLFKGYKFLFLTGQRIKNLHFISPSGQFL